MILAYLFRLAVLISIIADAYGAASITPVANVLRFCARLRTKLVNPPIAKATSPPHNYHQQAIADPYQWMRNDQGPTKEMLAHLQLENSYARTMLQPLCDIKQQIYSRLEELDTVDSEAENKVEPLIVGNFVYSVKYPPGQSFNAVYRKDRQASNGVEQMILDRSSFGATNYFEIAQFKVSPDGKYIAIVVNLTGTDQYIVRFLDHRTGKLLPNIIQPTKPTIEWSSDGQSIIYLPFNDNTKLPSIYRYHINAMDEANEHIYTEKEPGSWITFRKTTTGAFFLFTIAYRDRNAVYSMSTNSDARDFRLVYPYHAPGHYYSVEHLNSQFLIITNMAANGQIGAKYNYFVFDVNVPYEQIRWTQVLQGAKLNSASSLVVSQKYLAVFERSFSKTKIKIYSFDANGRLTPTATMKQIDLPKEPSTISIPSQQPAIADNRFRYSTTSLIRPSTLFECDMANGQCGELYNMTPAKYDANLYTTVRITADAPAGMGPAANGQQTVKIPITLAYRKDKARMNGSNPAWLNGYGAYGIVQWPTFSSKVITLLDQGFVYAIAHVRGGGEMGSSWILGGIQGQKQNSFNDFIAVANKLFMDKYTQKGQLVIEGGSAGGMLVGAVMNQQPDLAEVAIAKMPFVDVLNTMMDASLPLTKSDYSEWGNPTDPNYFRVIHSYSPYDNIKVGKKYPNILVRVGLKDNRVPYWDPSKWVARLRASNVASSGPQDTNPHTILQLTDMNFGHFGGSSRIEALENTADEIAFAIRKLEKARKRMPTPALAA